MGWGNGRFPHQLACSPNPRLRICPSPSKLAESDLMKIAYTTMDKPIPMPAAADAPTQAVCPDCGGVVMRRCRRSMDGKMTYFWRHRDNRDRRCRGRKRPFM